MLLTIFKRLLRKGRFNEGQVEERLEETVMKIQAGDVRLREKLLADYRPYIAKLASRYCGRFVDPSRDDEFSVALSAFNEAIDRFRREAGSSFLGFAETVIRARLIDFLRKERKFFRQIPYSSFEGKEGEDNAAQLLENRPSMERYHEEQIISERKQEIMELARQLGEFGITFQDLVRASPKHRDSRETLVRIALSISGDKSLLEPLLSKKTLPLKDILRKERISQKTLERNRKYIIAAVLIFHGAYPHLKEYLKNFLPPARKE